MVLQNGESGGFTKESCLPGSCICTSRAVLHASQRHRGRGQ
jgi:hypothetical protein